jgi:hypothetical protein
MKKQVAQAKIPTGLLSADGNALIGDVEMGGGMSKMPLPPVNLPKKEKVVKEIEPVFQPYYDRVKANLNILIPEIDFKPIGTQVAFILPVAPKTTTSGIIIMDNLNQSYTKRLNRLPVLLIAMSEELHDPNSTIQTKLKVGQYVWMSKNLRDSMAILPLRTKMYNEELGIQEDMELLIGIADISFVLGSVKEDIHYFREMCESRLDVYMGMYRVQPADEDRRKKFMEKIETELELIAKGCPYTSDSDLD